jgi:RHS repeat-associated protein
VYTYDQGLAADNPKGRLTSVTDAAATSQLYYDQRGNTKRKTITPVNGTPRTIDSTYDSQNQIKTLTYPDGEALTYLYNPPGGITAIQSSLVPDNVTMEDYDAAGQPWTISYGNGISSAYIFDPSTNRLASLVTGNMQNLAYAYDPVGNILNITDAVQSTRSQIFTYDHLNRLDTAYSEAYDPIGGNDTIDYAYNDIGNMTLNSRLGTYQYTNPSHVHAVTQAGPNSYQYNANGNMTGGEGGNLSITWNYDNKPATIQQGGTAISLLYDYSGHRVKKTVGSTSTVYIDKYCECTGTACKKHIFAGPRRIATKTASDTLYYHPDHLGSSAIVTNSSGIKAKEIYYYPYGETRTESGSADIKHKYTGQELDNETGIYNYKARYYHPALARFISPDTVVPSNTDPQSLNRYSYVLNNPINLTDPSGHMAAWWHFGIDFVASVASGQGFLQSIKNGWNNMMVDFNDSNSNPQSYYAYYANQHAMPGFPIGEKYSQTPTEAAIATKSYADWALRNGYPEKANHAVIDSAQKTHTEVTAQEYNENIQVRAWHWLRDALPTPSEIGNAFSNVYGNYQASQSFGVNIDEPPAYSLMWYEPLLPPYLPPYDPPPYELPSEW